MQSIILSTFDSKSEQRNFPISPLLALFCLQKIQKQSKHTKLFFPKWREVSSVFFLYYAIGRLLTRQHTHNKSAYTANNSSENDNGPEC